MESLNEMLKMLYTSPWETFTNQYGDKIDSEEINLAWPLLLKINEDEYWKSDLKIMILGKETNNWTADRCYGEGIDNILNYYYDFTGFGDCLKTKNNNSFWRGVKLFYKMFTESLNDRKLFIIWNNVLKIGIDKRGTPQPYIRELGKRLFPIQDEINILKPDFILFLSGHNYDKYINETLNCNIEVKETFCDDKLVKLKIPIPDFPISFRTEHPLTMQLQWTGNKKQIVFEKIIEQIVSGN